MAPVDELMGSMHMMMAGAQRSVSSRPPASPEVRAAIAEAAPIFREDELVRMWSGSFGSHPLTARVNTGKIHIEGSVTDAADGARRVVAVAEVPGTIHAPDGSAAGSFHREVHLHSGSQPHIDHSLLRLRPQWQGSGFATDFNAHAEQHYRRLGVSRIDVGADLDVGGYAWAARGFEFSAAGADEATRRVGRAETARRLIENVHRKGSISDAELGALQHRLYDGGGIVRPDTISSAGEVAALGEGELGKRILLGQVWKGVRELT